MCINGFVDTDWAVRDTESEVRVILADAMYRYRSSFPFTAVIVFSKDDGKLLDEQQQVTQEDIQAPPADATGRSGARSSESSQSFS